VKTEFLAGCRVTQIASNGYIHHRVVVRSDDEQWKRSGVQGGMELSDCRLRIEAFGLAKATISMPSEASINGFRGASIFGARGGAPD
jgi:hypothetical protein